MFVPFTAASFRTSSACDDWSTRCSTKSSMICFAFILARIAQGDGDDFLRGGETGEHLAGAVFAQRAHSELPRPLAQEQRGLAVIDHAPDSVVDRENFEDPDAALVAAVAALLTAHRFHYGRLVQVR